MTIVNKKEIYKKVKNNPGPYYQLALYRACTARVLGKTHLKKAH